MKIWSKEEEGEALRKRFDDLKKNEGVSRADFARKHGLKGGDSMIYQHITGHRPMNIDAAIVYAKGFACELHEISPRLAVEAKEMAVAIGAENNAASDSPQKARPLEEGMGKAHGWMDRPHDNELPIEFQTLLNTITDAARTGGMTPEQAAAFDVLIKTSTGTK